MDESITKEALHKQLSCSVIRKNGAIVMKLTEVMKRMKQLSLAETGSLPKAGKQIRKAVFLAEMEQVVPWFRLEALIEPHYPKKGSGRLPMLLGTMLRIHFIQQWFGYSDPAMGLKA